MILTSIRHPQANMVERANRELSRFFRTFLAVDKHDSWYNWIEEIETILNESYHDTIEITPYEALLGKKPTRLGEIYSPNTIKSLSKPIRDHQNNKRENKNKGRTSKCKNKQKKNSTYLSARRASSSKSMQRLKHSRRKSCQISSTVRRTVYSEEENCT